MNSHTLTPSRSHARPSLLSRLFRKEGQERAGGKANSAAGADPFPGYDAETEWRRARQDRPREVAHEPAVPAGVSTEPWGPWDAPDGLLLDQRSLTDGRVVPGHVRPAAPRPLDIYSDLRDLPQLRDTIRAATQRGCTQCGTCGRALRGATWAERFAAQLAHLGSGEDVPSLGAIVSVREPDFDLRRWDGVVDEIVDRAQAAADVADAFADYQGRHTAGTEAA